MSRKEKARRRYWFWFTIFVIYLAFGLYCICTNFGDTLGMILLATLCLSISWFICLGFYEPGNG